MKITIDILSAVCAIVAAYIWWQSAKVKTPDKFNIHVVKPNAQPMGGNPMGGTYMGHAYGQDLNDLAGALKRQSQLSARAAIFAGAAAFLQSISLIIGVCIQISN